MRIQALTLLLLLSLLQIARGEENPFKGNLEVGVTLTDGNSETEAITLGFDYKHNWNEKNQVIVETDYNYGEAENEKNADNGKADLEYRRALTERVFGHFHTSYETDDIATLDHRVLVGLGPGIGLIFIDSEKDTLSVEMGLSYFDSKQAGVTENGILFRFSQDFEHRFNDRARFVQTLEYLPETEELERYLLNASVAIESGFTERMSIRLSIENKYNSDPEGDTQENDLAFKGGIIFRL